MIAIFILGLSVAALIEFAIAQWRSVWIAIAAQPLSEYLQTATGIASEAIGPEDFDRLVRTTEQLCPSPREGNAWLREVRTYYRAVQALDRICEKKLPGLSAWAKGELAACSRYAAVVLDQRLNASLAYASELRGL